MQHNCGWLTDVDFPHLVRKPNLSFFFFPPKQEYLIRHLPDLLFWLSQLWVKNLFWGWP